MLNFVFKKYDSPANDTVCVCVCVCVYVSEFKEWDFKKEIQQTIVGVFLLYVFANLIIVIVDFGHGEVELLHIPELILGFVFSTCVWLLKQRQSDFKHTCRRIKDKLIRYKMSEVKFLNLCFFFAPFFLHTVRSLKKQ